MNEIADFQAEKNSEVPTDQVAELTDADIASLQAELASAEPSYSEQAELTQGKKDGQGPPEQPSPPVEADADPRKRAMKDVVLALALAQDITLFTDQHGTAFCRIPRDDHFELLPVDGKPFADWLGYLLYAQESKTCSVQTLDPARRVLRAKANYEGKTHRLYNRTAWGDDGGLYYDMSDAHWQAILIESGGWVMEPTPPILFKRYKHQAPQVLPVRVDDAVGTLAGIFEFVNLTSQANRLLFTVYLVSLFVPGIAHPIPSVHGEQGSGKSVAFKKTRCLADPSSVLALSVPWKSDEFVQQLDHHWCAYYDNVQSLSDWQQDVLCRAVTGEGHTKRALYTDEDDVIFTYRRCVALNGINVTSTRPDLLSRCILFELSALGADRQGEKELDAHFEALRPRLLGAILDVLVGALSADETTADERGCSFRMADWAAWGWRIGEALGGRGDEFLRAYHDAVQSKSRMALELHPLGQAVRVFMADRDTWTGSPKALLDELIATADSEGIPTDKTPWPGSPSWLGRRLKEVKPDLRTAGITYQDSRGDDRNYTLTKTPDAIDATVAIPLTLLHTYTQDREEEEGNEGEVACRGVKGMATMATMATVNEAPDPPPDTCYACMGSRFWQRPDGGWVCSVCHPATGRN